MASLSLKNICKVYPNGFEAVKDFNLEVEDQEFIIFVGPSGCGKSTTLRMIAGLEEISSGEFYIDGKLMNDVEPKDRDIAMVFQNYALYPHMTVFDNMAFGLKLRKVPKDEIKKNIIAYGEFLPETFFTEIGTAKVLDVIKNGNTAEQKKLFKMLNEVYEDGTNEVQDVIGVTILGAMQNDKDMMAVADKYMSEYMSGPVHEINKLTAKNNSKLMKKLKNPPAYKPKKKKNNFMQNALQAQDMNR